MAEKKERPPFRIVLIGAVVLTALIYGCNAITGSSDKVEDEVNERTAIAACQDSVKNQLVAPGSADFSQVTTKEGDGEYVITGFVTATSEDGGVAKRRWVCKATPDGDDTYVGTATIIE